MYVRIILADVPALSCRYRVNNLTTLQVLQIQLIVSNASSPHALDLVHK